MRDAFTAVLMLAIYLPLLIGQDFFVHLWKDSGTIGKLIVCGQPLAAVTFWLWMIFDWGRKEIRKPYKLVWFIMFFLTFVIGATLYYVLVCKLKKGLVPQKLVGGKGVSP